MFGDAYEKDENKGVFVTTLKTKKGDALRL